MRSPENVLESLKSKACNKSYKYERLYRNLYNPQFYLLAYQRIQAKPGNMTAGTDGKTIDGMGMARINALIEKMRDFSYQPNPARRTYIPKSNGKMRPLGIPSFDDKLIQEVVRLILESIYEPTFSDYSHGFRINRSCHTALKYVQKYFTGTKWFVEGDIKGCFDNVDHHVLIAILRKRIADEHFIGLLWKFLKAGYMEDWNYHNTYSGTPQGSIISPILANIYMNELDSYMAEYAEKFNCGNRRKINPAFKKKLDVCRGKEQRLKRNLSKMSEEEKEGLITEIRELRRSLKSMPYSDQMDDSYKRICYLQLQKDIEHQKVLERAQQDFFSSASHELKTPITIIKGQLEGMLLGIGAYKDHEKYLARSLEVAATLETMVQEILTISRLETNVDFKMEHFDCAPMIHGYLREIDDLVATKELQIHLAIQSPAFINGNKLLIEKVFSNLISNAVKYSPHGASVDIILQNTNGRFLFSVENTGTHIPEDDIPKLFDAFYRMEQSRSRRTGGSGLGLYMVQRILQQHNSYCEACNTENGVKFFFTI